MVTHKDWTRVGPVTVRLAGGREATFPTIEAAVLWAGWWRVDAYQDYAHNANLAVLVPGHPELEPPVVFIDEIGMRIPAWRVMLAARSINLEETSRPRLRWHWRIRYDGSTFRTAPVPGTGKRGGGHYFRRPRTTQERRAAAAFETEREYIGAGGKVRARRNAANLVNAWDDIRRSRDDRSWKACRRTQWRDRAQDS